MKYSMLLFLFFISITSLIKANTVYDVKDFGAKGDGTVLETASIQNAIDKAYEDGGGIVDVPAGTYKIGTLILKDNINLHLQPGAKLLGSPDYKDYTEVKQKYESRTSYLYAKYFMIYAEGAKNIAITGKGIIHGNGLKYFQESDPQNLRPFMIRFTNCRNITVRDVQLLEAANWTFHLLGCKDVFIDNIEIENHIDANRDGLDIDCSERVMVSNSRFFTGDDAIIMKATSDSVCRDITITNCVLTTGGSAIKTGTESNGGFKNITVSNCVIKDVTDHAGIELMQVDGGAMQNIVLDNISMENVRTPIFIRVGLRLRPYKAGQYVKKVEEVRDIYLNNITVTDAWLPSSIMGMHDRKIKNISITNYTVRYSKSQEAIPYNKVPLKEFDYPMAIMFRNLPAYGLYCRNVEGLNLQNIKMYTINSEKRPGFVFDRVNNLELNSISAEVNSTESPMAYFRNSQDIYAAFCRSEGKGYALFEVEGNSNKNVNLVSNFARNDEREIVNVAPLKDNQIFDDFESSEKISIDKGEQIDGLTAKKLGSNPFNVEMKISDEKTPQLCLLIMNKLKKPEKVYIKYQGITQEFLVDWNEWGWAPISLLKKFKKNQKVSFDIYTENNDGGLEIAKVYIRYQNLEYTD